MRTEEAKWTRRFSRSAVAVLALAITSATFHGCTYVACAGFAGGVMFATVCVPMLAATTTTMAVVATWRHHAERTSRSRVVAVLAITPCVLGALTFGAVLLYARTTLAEGARDFPAELVAFDDLAMQLGIGAACWLLAAIALSVVVLRVAPKA
jgi:hypothetical protein